MKKVKRYKIEIYDIVKKSRWNDYEEFFFYLGFFMFLLIILFFAEVHTLWTAFIIIYFSCRITLSFQRIKNKRLGLEDE